jgi:hypothetical protein
LQPLISTLNAPLIPVSGGVGKKVGPSLSSGLSSVKISIVQPPAQPLALPVSVKPLAGGVTLSVAPRIGALPPVLSLMPLSPLLLVVVWVILLLIVPAPLTYTP